MGIRDYLKDWVDPYDSLSGWKEGDKAVTTRSSSFGDFTIPEGAEVTISAIPEPRHGADLYGLGSISWTDPETGELHKWCECALSAETDEHHFGYGGPGVRRPEEAENG